MVKLDGEFIENGLSEQEVAQRTADGQVNNTGETPTKTVRQIFRTNIFTFFNLINVILAVCVIAVGSYRNVLFMGVILSNTAIGIFQEMRAKRTIDRLSLISAPKATVVRGGKTAEIAVNEIVRGDLIIIGTGKQVCSDSVVLDGECEVNESLVTGESDPVCKKRGDELLSGSFVISGKVKAEVVRVGKDNFASKITNGAKYLKKQNSEMMRSINVIIKVVAFCIIPMSILLFWRAFGSPDQTFERAVTSTVAAIIGMIPEGLVLLASMVMAVSAIRLSLHNTLVQDMYCIETLARVDVLCLDKTGTITEGIMQVEKTQTLAEKDDFPVEDAVKAFVKNMTDNNPTFNAVKAKWGGESDLTATRILPFSSEKKWSGAEFGEKGSVIFGAPEFILGKLEGKIKELCDEAAGNGQRVLLFAYSKNAFNDKALPDGIEPLELIIIGDVIRADAPETLKYFREQNVDIKIISGDNPLTVARIAGRAGVENSEKYVDASTLSPEQIPQAVKDYTVFGRVSPDQKLAMVKALKAQKHIVGMTGDGVNDVLALKEADCSVAMQSGSDAAKNVSNLVLLDSNFASMPKVVAEGRRSVNNIERSAMLFLTKTIYSFLLAIVFIFITEPYPFEPIQLTLVNAVAIGIPSFLLALEPNFNIIRGRFMANVMRKAIPQGISVTVCTAAVALFGACMSFAIDQTGTLATVVIASVSFLILAGACIPFNKWKAIMFALMIAIFLVGIFKFEWLFLISDFDITMLIAEVVLSGIAMLLLIFVGKLCDPILMRIFAWSEKRAALAEPDAKIKTRINEWKKTKTKK